MAKDYAKRVFTTKNSPPKKKRRLEFFIVPLVIFVLLTIFLTFTIKMNLHTSNSSFIENVKSYFASKKATVNKTVQLPVAKAELHRTPASQIHFDFYNTLPNMKPNQPPIKHDPEAPIAPQYIVQLGIFQSETEASQNRLSLLLAGYEATIVKIKDEKGEAYRIQRGPFASQLEAKKIQKKLLNKGIASEVKKI